MTLHEYLKENLTDAYDWEKYAHNEVDIKKFKDNVDLTCKVWDHINEWSNSYAEECGTTDASLIARVFTETASLIYSFAEEIRETKSIHIFDVSELCSVYGRCCIFARNIMPGNELFDKCRFIVNNNLVNAVFSKKSIVVKLSDIENADLEDEWEDL